MRLFCSRPIKKMWILKIRRLNVPVLEWSSSALQFWTIGPYEIHHWSATFESRQIDSDVSFRCYVLQSMRFTESPKKGRHSLLKTQQFPYFFLLSKNITREQNEVSYWNLIVEDKMPRMDRRESLFPSCPWPTRCLFSIFTLVQTLLRHRRTFHETKISTRSIAGEQSQFVWLSDRYSSTHLVQIPHGHVRNIFRFPHLLYRVLSRR